MPYRDSSDLPQRPSRRQSLAVLSAGALGLLTGAPALAQSVSRGHVRVVTSGDPGSLGDLIARVLAEKLQPLVGQTVVVDNRPGVAVFQGTWALEQLWVFWLVPLVGALAGGLIYRCLLPHRPPQAGDEAYPSANQRDAIKYRPCTR